MCQGFFRLVAAVTARSVTAAGRWSLVSVYRSLGSLSSRSVAAATGRGWWSCALRPLHAHHAAADAGAEVTRLEGLRLGFPEHLVLFDDGEPEAVGVAVVITRPSPVTLDEGRAPELLQTGARRRQGLSRALGPRAGVHHEGVADPQSLPAGGTRGDLDGLTVDCDDHGWDLTNRTPADVRFDALSGDRGHGHGHGLGRGQPVRVVVPRGKVTNVVDVTEHEGHSAEATQTAARRTEVLSVRPLVALHVEQGVAVVDEVTALGAEGHLCGLAVSGDEEAVSRGDRAGGTGRPLRSI